MRMKNFGSCFWNESDVLLRGVRLELGISKLMMSIFGCVYDVILLKV